MNWHEVGQPLHRDADLDDASMPAVYAHGYQFGTAEQTLVPIPPCPPMSSRRGQRRVAAG